MKKKIIPLLLLVSSLLMGMDWVQETPTDSDGCAGYKPSNYEEPSGDYSRIYSYGDEYGSDSWSGTPEWEDAHGAESDPLNPQN